MCCPRVLGALVYGTGVQNRLLQLSTGAHSRIPVYAVDNKRIGLRTAFRNKETWDQVEVYFWTQETCFPGIGS